MQAIRLAWAGHALPRALRTTLMPVADRPLGMDARVLSCSTATMKKTLQCPKCNCTQLFYVPVVADRHEKAMRGGNSPAKLAYVPQEAMLGHQVADSAGTIEAYACQGCGYVEYYLKERLHIDGTNVIHVQGTRQPPPPST